MRTRAEPADSFTWILPPTSFTTTRFEIVWPLANSWTATAGSSPAGVTRTYPAALGLNTSVLTTTDVASVGTPPSPAICTSRGAVVAGPSKTRTVGNAVNESARTVTAGDGADAAPVPAMFVAVTVKVYAVPWDRPVTVTVEAPVVVAVRPPGDAVTVYPVIGDPPLLTGAVHDAIAWPFPGVAATPVGVVGAVLPARRAAAPAPISGSLA